MLDFGLLAIPTGLSNELSFDDVLWMQMEKNPEVPGPIAYAGCIYMVKDGGWVTCMDAKSGEVYYQEKIGAPGPYIASPVLADGRIYLLLQGRTCMCVLRSLMMKSATALTVFSGAGPGLKEKFHTKSSFFPD